MPIFRHPSPRSSRLLCSSALLLFGTLGCGRSSTQASEALGSASTGTVILPGTPHVITTEEPSSPSAFELAATAQGLHLLWANAANSAGWLSDAELGHDGLPRTKPRRLGVPARALGIVTDLSAAFVGEQLALAWVEQGKQEARAEATLIAGAEPPVLLDLGPAALSAISARGNIAVAAESEAGRALVMWRGLEAPCVEPQTTACVGFTFRRLRVGGSETTGLPLSVPVPCAAHSVQLVVSARRFHYGVCTREGPEPVTTMFSIQYEPEYARAEALLKGCLPLGTVDVGGQPWLIGDCHGKRKAVPVPLTDEKVQAEYVDALRIGCTPERAELRQGRFVVTLREPRADLTPILPANLLPTGARAGWTGKSLVVAYLAGSRLQTRSYACRAGTLQPL